MWSCAKQRVLTPLISSPLISPVLNWYDEPISTGPLEGINNKIGALQRRAYGYRNYEHLKQRLLTLHHTKCSLVG